ncbi:hypothetical protein IFT45_13710 [Frigoribacterium sp. CFBP 13707]|nr:hypothetical protein [Frigoribacterium sp. CFBP 13707]
MSLLTPGLPAYETAMRSSTAELVTALRELLGAKLVAYVGSVGETRAVRQWAEGQRHPSAAVERRLRLTFQVAGLLAERDDARVIQSWFQGMNPQLEDDSPARMLRDDDLDIAGPRVLAAARSFAAVG